MKLQPQGLKPGEDFEKSSLVLFHAFMKLILVCVVSVPHASLPETTDGPGQAGQSMSQNPQPSLPAASQQNQ